MWSPHCAGYPMVLGDRDWQVHLWERNTITIFTQKSKSVVINLSLDNPINDKFAVIPIWCRLSLTQIYTHRSPGRNPFNTLILPLIGANFSMIKSRILTANRSSLRFSLCWGIYYLRRSVLGTLKWEGQQAKGRLQRCVVNTVITFGSQMPQMRIHDNCQPCFLTRRNLVVSGLSRHFTLHSCKT